MRTSGSFAVISGLTPGLLCGLLCGSCKDPPKPSRAEAAAPPPKSSAPEVASSSALREDARAPAFDAGAQDAGAEDAGSSACRLLYGPAEQPFRGPAALIAASTGVELVENDLGKPLRYEMPAGPITPGPPPAPSATPPVHVGTWPACAALGAVVYCQGPGGLVQRVTAAGVRVVAKARASTPIVAAELHGGHTVIGYFAERRTTEGPMLEAFAAVDEDEPLRISEDGSGATVLRLVPFGEKVIALYLDARSAMTPVHSRTIAIEGGKTALGKDAVIFVGGPPERGITSALAVVEGRRAFALVPMPRDTATFGMAEIPIEDPPKDDMPAIWSMYPNGLDPAPLAVASSAKGTYVARVRPLSSDARSARALELGKLDTAGAFSSLGVVAAGKPFADVAIAVDSFGAVWLAYGDARGAWVERRACP